jgi:hypothetical protein
MHANPQPPIEHIFMSSISRLGVTSHILKELFPKARLIYSTKHVRPTMESLMEVMSMQSWIATNITWKMEKVRDKGSMLP